MAKLLLTLLCAWVLGSWSSTPPHVVVVCGASGVGKTTVTDVGLTGLESKITTPVMHTTRARRPTEVDGVDYNFVTEDEFKTMESENKFLLVSPHNGAGYGLSLDVFQKAEATGKVVFMEHISSADAKALKIANRIPDAKYVDVVPPGHSVAEMLDVIRGRLSGRGTESAASMNKRLESAGQELSYAEDKELWDKVVVNDNMYVAAADFRRFFVATFGVQATTQLADTEAGFPLGLACLAGLVAMTGVGQVAIRKRRQHLADPADPEYAALA